MLKAAKEFSADPHDQSKGKSPVKFLNMQQTNDNYKIFHKPKALSFQQQKPETLQNAESMRMLPALSTLLKEHHSPFADYVGSHLTPGKASKDSH